MDFGKLAYLNIEDLNKRLKSIENKTNIIMSNWQVNKTLNEKIQDNYTFEIKFSSAKNTLVTIIGKLRLIAEQQSTIDFACKLNGFICYVDRIELNLGEREYFFFFCTQGQLSNRLGIVIDGQDFSGRLISYDFIISGGNVRGFESDVNIQLINRESKNIVGLKIEDKICCYVSDTCEFDFFKEPLVLGEGQDFSLCQGFDDDYKTALTYIGQQKELKFEVLGSHTLDIDNDVDCAAVAPIAIGYLIVYIQDSKPFYRIVYPTNQVSGKTEIILQSGVYETVRAVFDAPYPMFLFKTIDQKIYLKTANSIITKEKISSVNLSTTPYNLG